MPLLSRIAALALLALVVALSFAPVVAPVAAQSIAGKPLKLVVPFGPGGSGDTIARLIALHLPERIGQPVGVENRMGRAAISAPTRWRNRRRTAARC